ncbi:DUF2569 domain-containing protein [uncultured Pseudomonas sp.]|uniref:DUF2569 domain-containing protein n=1 Tax=uncultured Pseudomonas sp. TaxID=114707 RepID=UPI00345CE8C8
MNMQTNKDLKGLGGWLILIALGLIVTPLRVAIAFGPLYYGIFTDGTFTHVITPGSELYNPAWAALVVFEALFNSLLILTFIYLIYLFFSRHYLFPKVYIATLIVSFAFVPLDSWIVSLIVPDEPIFDPSTTKEFVRGLISVVVWVPYILVSKRVKATFVEHRPDAEPKPRASLIEPG